MLFVSERFPIPEGSNSARLGSARHSSTPRRLRLPSVINATMASKNWKTPAVLADARFGAARTLVTTSHADQAVDAFAVLLEHAIAKFGPDHVEAGILYYEYGNAIFRAHLRASPEEESGDVGGAPESAPMLKSDVPPSHEKGSTTRPASSSAVDRRKAPAEAAERRLNQAKGYRSDEDLEGEGPRAAADGEGDVKDGALPVSGKLTLVDEKDAGAEEGVAASKADSQTVDAGNDDGKEDVLLALEMMETCWSILDQYVSSSNSTTTSGRDYVDWAADQLPRVLTGLGDVLSNLGRHADAADAYLRALGLRQAALQERFDASALDACLAQPSSGGSNGSALLSSYQRDQLVDWLVCRRRIVEANVLIAEELLAHGEVEGGAGRDVVTTETQTVLVSAKERVEYARGYYESSREQLQEAVLLLGQLKAKLPDHEPLEEEKENVCFAATLVMGVGEALAALDEGEPPAAPEPIAKRLKS
jgi:tetratricopeptide (TPR) repeat protein